MAKAIRKKQRRITVKDIDRWIGSDTVGVVWIVMQEINYGGFKPVEAFLDKTKAEAYAKRHGYRVSEARWIYDGL